MTIASTVEQLSAKTASICVYIASMKRPVVRLILIKLAMKRLGQDQSGMKLDEPGAEQRRMPLRNVQCIECDVLQSPRQHHAFHLVISPARSKQEKTNKNNHNRSKRRPTERRRHKLKVNVIEKSKKSDSPLARVRRFVTKNALQSQKWQLIDTSYRMGAAHYCGIISPARKFVNFIIIVPTSVQK